jgi:hypothetical protein
MVESASRIAIERCLSKRSSVIAMGRVITIKRSHPFRMEWIGLHDFIEN